MNAVIVEMGPGFACQIRFASGEVVPAHIPRQVARRMFRIVAGDQVIVERNKEMGQYVVLAHAM